MSAKKKIILIHPDARSPALPGLADALRAEGAEVEQHFLTGDYTALLDALSGDALPVVVKT